jgi:putative FmdB family regulatory protein
MPTYCYEAAGEDGCPHCLEGFDVVQSMKDDPLEACPRCGASVRRAVTAPYVNTRPSSKSILRDDNLKRHGFTKLVNEGGGKFRKI